MSGRPTYRFVYWCRTCLKCSLELVARIEALLALDIATEVRNCCRRLAVDLLQSTVALQGARVSHVIVRRYLVLGRTELLGIKYIDHAWEKLPSEMEVAQIFTKRTRRPGWYNSQDPFPPLHGPTIDILRILEYALDMRTEGFQYFKGQHHLMSDRAEITPTIALPLWLPSANSLGDLLIRYLKRVHRH